VTWLMHMCDMTHSYVWHDSCICVTWLIHMYDMTHAYVFMCETRLVHTCDMTRSHVWHDSLECVTRIIGVCDVAPSWEWCDWITCDSCNTPRIFSYKSLLRSLLGLSFIYICDWITCMTWHQHLQWKWRWVVWRDSFHVWHDSFVYIRIWR